MAVNLNRRRGPKPEMSVPLGSLSVVKDSKLKKPDADVASVVVTISEGSSYDDLFKKLPQESEYGRVSVFQLAPGMIMEFVRRALDGEDINSFKFGRDQDLPTNIQRTLLSLKNDCIAAGPDAVCFNFECCSGFSEGGFSNGNQFSKVYMDFIAFLVKEFGCMTMFSDFSLKALIKSWDAEVLGPLPFAQVGTFGGSMRLAFDPERLQKSPSAQLNTVGNLCESKDGKGTATLKALASTIAFTITEEARQIAVETEQTIGTNTGVDPLKRKYIQPFEVEVLSVAEMVSNISFSKNKLKEIEKDAGLSDCQIAGKEMKGLGGHVLLTFPPSARNIARYQTELMEEEAARKKAIEEKVITADVKSEDEITPVRGMILVSSGHWVELMKLDVNLDRLIGTVQTDWGVEADRFQVMQEEVKGLANAERRASYTCKKANSYVQSRPAAKFNFKLKRKKKFGY